MAVQEPEVDSEYNPDWLRGDPEWRRYLQELNDKIAAMLPEEERAYWDEANKQLRRTVAASRRAAAARRGGNYSTAPMYAGGKETTNQ